MVRYRTFNITVSVVCFAIVWSINENILALFVIPGKPAITWWVKSISAIGIFAFLFQLMIWASQNAIKKWFSEESRITGDWYQVFKIHNYKTTGSPIKGRVKRKNTSPIKNIPFFSIGANCPSVQPGFLPLIHIRYFFFSVLGQHTR